jgi:hypothetical protein
MSCRLALNVINRMMAQKLNCSSIISIVDSKKTDILRRKAQCRSKKRIRLTKLKWWWQPHDTIGRSKPPNGSLMP